MPVPIRLQERALQITKERVPDRGEDGNDLSVVGTANGGVWTQLRAVIECRLSQLVISKGCASWYFIDAKSGAGKLPITSLRLGVQRGKRLKTLLLPVVEISAAVVTVLLQPDLTPHHPLHRSQQPV